MTRPHPRRWQARAIRTIPSENVEAPVDSPDPLVERLARALRRFRLQSAHNLLDEALAGRSPPEFLREVAEPVLARLEGEDAARRFAESMFEQRLLVHARGWQSVRGPVVVLACAPREEDVLGLIALGIELAQRGCRISYLGAATPAAAVRATAREQRAAVVVISAAAGDLTAAELAELQALARECPLALVGAAAADLVAATGGRALGGPPAVARLAHGQSSRESDDASPPGAAT